MKSIEIKNGMNGFVVIVDGIVDKPYVYRTVDDLLLLEFIGKIIAERRVKVETV